MNIRKAQEEDIGEITNLFANAYSEEPYNEKWSKKNVVEKVTGYFRYSSILVAFENNKLVGFIVFYKLIWDRYYKMYINELCVNKLYRGKGIATSLLNEVEKIARKEGVASLELASDIKSNAFRLYEKLGYEKTNMVIMEKKIK